MGTRKGIILAGGSGSRLYPLTSSVSKQLLPVYDKPMIYYPLAILMLAGMREILIITTPRDEVAFKELLGDGSKWGLTLSYAVQAEPKGLAEAFIIAENFLAGAPSCLILGDNIFYGYGLIDQLQRVSQRNDVSTIFGYRVKDPERYGVGEFDELGNLVALHEKPEVPASNWAITGLYFYDEKASEMAKTIVPSARGELEITDLNQLYLDQGNLELEKLGRGVAWLDTGTHESLIQAGNFIETIEQRQGLKVCCPEEVAYYQGWISREQLRELGEALQKSGYGEYLLNIYTHGLEH